MNFEASPEASDTQEIVVISLRLLYSLISLKAIFYMACLLLDKSPSRDISLHGEIIIQKKEGSNMYIYWFFYSQTPFKQKNINYSILAEKKGIPN